MLRERLKLRSAASEAAPCRAVACISPYGCAVEKGELAWLCRMG